MYQPEAPASQEELKVYEFQLAVNDIGAELKTIAMAVENAADDSDHLSEGLDETLSRWQQELGPESYENAVQTAMLDFYQSQFSRVEQLYPDGYKVSLAAQLRQSLDSIGSMATTNSLGLNREEPIQTIGELTTITEKEDMGRRSKIVTTLNELQDLDVVSSGTRIDELKGILNAVVGEEAYENEQHKKYILAKAHLAQMVFKLADQLTSTPVSREIAQKIAAIKESIEIAPWVRADELV